MSSMAYDHHVRAARITRSPEPERSALRIPAEKYRAAIGELLVDDAGNLIVQRRDLLGTGDDEDAPITWDFIAPDWRVRARFHTPVELKLRLLDGCTLYGILTNDSDEESVARYHLEPCPLDQ